MASVNTVGTGVPHNLQPPQVGLKLSVDDTNDETRSLGFDFNAELVAADYAKEIDIEIKSTKPLTGKQYLLVIPITKFFKKLRNLYILINILNGRSVISLRLIEYFVVNYVLENNTYYDLNKYRNKPDYIVNNLFANLEPEPNTASSSNNAIIQNQVKREIRDDVLNIARTQTVKTPTNFDDFFMIHDNYKCQLKEYNKKNFDPFCRWTRIRLYYDKTKYFYTTVAQLNFFKWAIENYILDYILDNLPVIEKAMNDYEKAIKKEKRIRRINSQINSGPVDLLLNIPPKLNSVDSSSNNKHINANSGPGILQTSMQTIPSLQKADVELKVSADDTSNPDDIFGNIDLTNITIDSNTNNSASPQSFVNTSVTLNSSASKTGLELSGNRNPDKLASIETTSLVKSGSPEMISNIDQQPKRKDPASIILLSTLDKKTKIKGRKKKEFTKTNRSILKYECTKIITFD